MPGEEPSIKLKSGAFEPEGVLLAMETFSSSCDSAPAAGPPLSIVWSPAGSHRAVDGLFKRAFDLFSVGAAFSEDSLPAGSPGLRPCKTVPHWLQRTACAEFSPLQEGQVIVETGRTTPTANYPARLGPSASNISALSGDEVSTTRVFPIACKLLSGEEETLWEFLPKTRLHAKSSRNGVLDAIEQADQLKGSEALS